MSDDPDPAGSDFDVASVVDDVTAMVRRAARRAFEWYRLDFDVANKAADGFDPVTAADRAVEDDLRRSLTRRFPHHAILGEERGATGDGRHRWVIDPIDGTRAFVSGQPVWGTLLGLQDGEEIVAGWLHHTAVDETYVATPAGGWLETSRGRRRLGTRSTTDLADAVLMCTHPDMFVDPAERAGFAAVDRAVRLTRYGGDCVNYGLLAIGTADLVIESDLQPYDIIPLVPIVEAAGGVVTDIDGNPPVAGGFVVAAANPELHAAALAVVRGAG